MSNEQNVEIFILALRNLLPTLHGQDNARIIRRVGKQVIEDCAADLIGFIESGSDSTLSKNERLALADQVMRCLAQYIKEEAKLPLTVNTCITNIGLLDYAVGNSFPGYSEARLLKYIILPLKRQPEIIPVRN